MLMTFNIGFDPNQQLISIEFENIRYYFDVPSFFEFLKACLFVADNALNGQDAPLILKKAAELVENYEKKQEE